MNDIRGKQHGLEDSQINWFNRNPKKTIGATIAAILLAGTTLIELALRLFMGLGNPVLYDSNPLYGYRPQPDQTVSRFHGSTVKINNLGLRANEDWDDTVDDKVLFLGDSVTYGGSNVSNEELFSHIAVANLDGYISGNAGVNAWGVENIHGLIVFDEFLPAAIYVTVVPELDFHRGMTRLLGLPYWNRKPNFALEELFYHLVYRISLNRYEPHEAYTTEEQREKVVENAVIKLQEVDSLLKAQGYAHLIYISPSREQVLNNAPRDETVSYYIQEYGLEVTYMLDQLGPISLTEAEKSDLFVDTIHLTSEGHRVWGEIIGEDLANVIDDD